MKLLILLGVLVFYNPILRAEDNVDFGVEIGLSTPNSQINNIYERDYQAVFQTISSIRQDTIIGDMLRDGAKVGYHFGVRVKVPLNDYFKFTGSIAYHRFQQSQIDVRHPVTQELLATLFTIQNIIPVSVGADFYFLKTGIMDFYVTGEVGFNKYSFSTDVPLTKDNTITLPIQESGSYNNFGADYGLGIDFHLALLKLNLDARYHVLDLVNSFGNNNKKNFLSLSLGIYF